MNTMPEGLIVLTKDGYQEKLQNEEFMRILSTVKREHEHQEIKDLKF